jgi:hypothetical protein
MDLAKLNQGFSKKLAKTKCPTVFTTLCFLTMGPISYSVTLLGRKRIYMDKHSG